MFETIVEVLGVSIFFYLFVGGYLAMKAWKSVPALRVIKPVSKSSKEYARLASRWDLYHRGDYYRNRPATTLEELLEGVDNTNKVAYCKKLAYKKTFMVPVWPLYAVPDVVSNYQTTKQRAAAYEIDLQTQQMEEMKKFQVQLEKAHADAQKTIDSFK